MLAWQAVGLGRAQIKSIQRAGTHDHARLHKAEGKWGCCMVHRTARKGKPYLGKSLLQTVQGLEAFLPRPTRPCGSEVEAPKLLQQELRVTARILPHADGHRAIASIQRDVECRGRVGIEETGGRQSSSVSSILHD